MQAHLMMNEATGGRAVNAAQEARADKKKVKDAKDAVATAKQEAKKAAVVEKAATGR